MYKEQHLGIGLKHASRCINEENGIDCSAWLLKLSLIGICTLRSNDHHTSRLEGELHNQTV